MGTLELFGWWLAGTSALFVGLFLLSRSLGTRMPRVFQVLWLVFFMKLLVPVGLWSPVPAPGSTLVRAFSTVWESAGSTPPAPATSPAGAPAGTSPGNASPSWIISVVSDPPAFLTGVLGALWLGGTLVFGGLSVRAYLRTLGRTASGPAAVGLFKPRLVLPPDFDHRFTLLEQELILAHERSHLRVGDPLWFFAVQAVTCLFWWFPAVWWARNEFLAVSELACDAAVLGGRSGDEARVYGQVMVRLASEGQLAAGAAFAGTFRGLKRRLTAAVRPVRCRGPWVLGLLLVSAGALGAVSLTPPKPDWVWPLPSPDKTVSQGVVWGAYADPAYADGSGLLVMAGTPVQAAVDGSIAEVVGDPDRGWTLKVDQPGGFQTWYGHLDLDPVPTPGTRVSQGDRLGLVHQAGPRYPASFCLAVYQGGKAVDPAGLFPGLPLGAHPDFLPGPLVWPLAGEKGRPSAQFGIGVSPFTGEKYFHKGTDQAVRPGTVVRAVAGGTVVQVDYEALGYGNFVTVDHGNGRYSRYAHLARVLVVQGQVLKAGEPLGSAGDSGLSTGPHLHWELWVNGWLFDPKAVEYGAP